MKEMKLPKARTDEQNEKMLDTIAQAFAYASDNGAHSVVIGGLVLTALDEEQRTEKKEENWLEKYDPAIPVKCMNWDDMRMAQRKKQKEEKRIREMLSVISGRVLEGDIEGAKLDALQALDFLHMGDEA